MFYFSNNTGKNNLSNFKHGQELRDYWAEYQRRCRAKKKGLDYKSKLITKEPIDSLGEFLDVVLDFQEMENEEWLEKNIFKRGL